MNITDYCDAINKDLVIRYYHSQGIRWTVSIAGAETKKNKSDAILVSEYGEGNTPSKAINGYIEKIKGKILVFDAIGASKRLELNVPSLEVYHEL